MECARQSPAFRHASRPVTGAPTALMGIAFRPAGQTSIVATATAKTPHATAATRPAPDVPNALMGIALVPVSQTSSAATAPARPSPAILHAHRPATGAPVALTATAFPHARRANTAATALVRQAHAHPAGAHVPPAAADTPLHTSKPMAASSAALTNMLGMESSALIGLMPISPCRQTAGKAGSLVPMDHVYQLENHAPHEKI